MRVTGNLGGRGESGGRGEWGEGKGTEMEGEGGGRKDRVVN